MSCSVVSLTTHAKWTVSLNNLLNNTILIPIPPFDAPLSRVVDIVGLLLETITVYLTILGMTTRYPEAVPLRNTLVKIVVRELLQFFSEYDLPKEV